MEMPDNQDLPDSRVIARLADCCAIRQPEALRAPNPKTSINMPLNPKSKTKLRHRPTASNVFAYTYPFNPSTRFTTSLTRQPLQAHT